MNDLFNLICKLNATGISWSIDKYPGYYVARVNSYHVVKREYIDDLFNTMIELANSPERPPIVNGWDD